MVTNNQFKNDYVDTTNENMFCESHAKSLLNFLIIDNKKNYKTDFNL